MDELMEMFNSFIGEALQREIAMEDDFTDLEKKLNECVVQVNERGTPVQKKKRPKRQISISEKHECTSNSRVEGEEAQKQQEDSIPNRSSARALDLSSSSKNTSNAILRTTIETASANESTARPSRMARLKAQEKLKEPSLMTKLRNHSSAVIVKRERTSTVANSTLMKGGKDADVGMEETAPTTQQNEQTYVEMGTENDANHANKIIPTTARHRKDEGFGSTNESSEKDEPGMANIPNYRDPSLMLIPLPIPKVEILSDEEMPPPKMPPPKMNAPKVRTKKKAAVKDEPASSSAVSSAESSMNSTSSSATSIDARRQRGKPPKVGNPVVPKVSMTEMSTVTVSIKSEKLSIVQSRQHQKEATNAARSSDKSVYEDAQEHQEQRAGRFEQEIQVRPLNIVLEKIVIPSGTAFPLSDLNGTFSVAKPSQANETFVMPPSAEHGITEVNSPTSAAHCNDTYNIPSKEIPDQPQAAAKEQLEQTFVIETTGKAGNDNPAQNAQKNLANASIMTEDDSVVENSPNQEPTTSMVKPKPITSAAAIAVTRTKKPLPTVPILKKSSSTSVNGPGSSTSSIAQQPPAKGNKELFNPCVMSPIKSRIEAFEKCATKGTVAKASTMGTPQARIAHIQKTISTPSLATTPQFSSLDSLSSVHSAQAKQSAYTPNCASQPIPKASSASKIYSMQSKALHYKPAGNIGSTAGNSTRSLSRESSCDRPLATGTGGTLSAASSTSSLLDEKKKKREEKQRLATLQREAMEREKREHAERLLREKEEKYRKLVHEKQEKLRIDANKKAKKLEEFEKRRQMEEQRALADQKREELAKQLELQRIDRELLDSLKQSQMKENQETKLHKQIYQQKLRQQQQQLLQQQQKAGKKKAAAAICTEEVFTFEMIDTDDTTDDEEDENAAARKKKRPPLPEWCQNTTEFRKNITLQGQIDTKVIDRLFSVRPMTPDLRQLFPSIDAYKLKRNSSAIWRTPPRYSQLP